MRRCKRCRQPLLNHRYHASDKQCATALKAAKRKEEDNANALHTQQS